MLFISACVSAPSSIFVLSFVIRPLMRNTGGWPTVMCKSLAPCFTHAESNLSMRIVPMNGPLAQMKLDCRKPVSLLYQRMNSRRPTKSEIETCLAAFLQLMHAAPRSNRLDDLGNVRCDER